MGLGLIDLQVALDSENLIEAYRIVLEIEKQGNKQVLRQAKQMLNDAYKYDSREARVSSR